MPGSASACRFACSTASDGDLGLTIAEPRHSRCGNDIISGESIHLVYGMSRTVYVLHPNDIATEKQCHSRR